MTQIQCDSCEKYFRTPSGRDWHVARTHVDQQSPVYESNTLPPAEEEESKLLGTELNALPEAFLVLQEQQEQGLATLRTQVEEISCVDSSQAAGLGHMRDTLDKLEARIGKIGDLDGRLDSLEPTVSQLMGNLDRLQRQVAAVSLLLMNLDEGQRPTTFADVFASRPSKEELVNARAMLRRS